MRLLQLSDLHLQASDDAFNYGWDTQRSWSDALDTALSLAPDAILLSGDLADDGAARSYARLLNSLSRYTGPVFAIPGNHDDPEVMRSVLTARCEFETATVAGWQLLLLNSVVAGSDAGHLSKNELARVDRTLESLAGPLVVAVHHPPLPVGNLQLDAIALNNGLQLLDQLAGAQQPIVVLCGHVHQDLAARRGDILILTCPATCRQFGRTAAPEIESLDPGMRILEFDEGGSVSTWIQRFCTEGNLADDLAH